MQSMLRNDKLFEDKYIYNVTTHIVKQLSKQGMKIELMDYLELSKSYKLVSR